MKVLQAFKKEIQQLPIIWTLGAVVFFKNAEHRLKSMLAHFHHLMFSRPNIFLTSSGELFNRVKRKGKTDNAT
jgi:hypothetical protein